MANHNRFVIRNDSLKALTLNIEPEGVFFPLNEGDKVSVSDAFISFPVTVKITNNDAGDPILSIWPGDGDVKVEKDGVNVLDLL